MNTRRRFRLFLLSNFITWLFITFYSIHKDNAILENSYDKRPRLTFSVVSDIHLHSGKDYRGYYHHDMEADRKFANALKDMNFFGQSQNALVINGDLTLTGTKAEYDCMNKVLDSNPHPKCTLFTIGNHEFYSAFQDKHGNMCIGGFPNGVSEAQCIHRFIDNTKMPNIYYDKWVQGYHFIMQGSEQSRISNRWNYDNAILSETQLRWLETQLKSYQSDSLTFIFLHQPILDADIGNTSFMRNAAKLHHIIKNHRVILFSGHSHETLHELSKIAYSDGLIVFNDSSVRNPVHAYHLPVDASEGLYVQVYDRKVIIRGRDFAHRAWINQSTLPIPLPVSLAYPKA